MFTVLVGNPGVGKGAALNPALAVLKEAGVANILSDNLTIQWVLEKLAEGFPQTTVGNNGNITVGVDRSAIVFTPELSTFLKTEQESNNLCNLWDSREHPYDYGTRGKGLYTIEKPCISILGAAPPTFLCTSLPKNSAESGITRRMNFVYSKEREKPLPWPKPWTPDPDLVDDLKYIHSHLQGEFKFDLRGKCYFESHYDVPLGEYDDEATIGYKRSKPAHILKVAMALSAAKRDDMTLREEDLIEARKRTDQVLKDLQVVFRAVGDSDMAQAADRVMKFVETKGYATRQEIMRCTWRHIGSVETLEVVLKALTESQMLSESTQGNKQIYKILQQP